MTQPAKSYSRVMLGRQSAHAAEYLAGGFIGANYEIHQGLSGQLPDAWRQLNATFIPVYLAGHPGKSRIAAGLACGALWTVAKGIHTGDVVLCPGCTGHYRVGEVQGDYFYAPGQALPHRRPVKWLPLTIARSAMSQALRNSNGSIGTGAPSRSTTNRSSSFWPRCLAKPHRASRPPTRWPRWRSTWKTSGEELGADGAGPELQDLRGRWRAGGPAVRHRCGANRRPGRQP